MLMWRAVSMAPVSLILTWLTLSGCQEVLGLRDFDVQDEHAASSVPAYVCRSHGDCPGPTGRATATFCTSKRRCAPLQSEDCSRLAGAELDPHALVLGAMFGTSGPDALVELARQRAVQLAVEEINERGGIPARDRPEPRSLLLIGCDSTVSVDRAAAHLAALGARAIVGLADSEQLLQVVRAHAIAVSMVTLSLAIAPDSVSSLLDADLAWLMAPTVEQRTPLLETTLRSLQRRLATERSAPLRLALMFRYDGAGRAGLSALREHELDGIQLGAPEQHAGRIRIDRYPENADAAQALVATYRSFAPDIIVMLGRGDDVSGFMGPLEQTYERDGENARPHYLLTEAAQGASLIDLAQLLPSLHERVHGVGAMIPLSSQPAWEAFQRRYSTRWNDGLAAAPRVAAAYDAVYALAYAIAGIEADHEVGGRIAQALHWLEPPEQTAAPVFEVGPDALAMSFGRLIGAERIGVYGASGELHWDGVGARSAGALEVWCLEASSGAVRFGSAPLTYNIATQRYGSRPANCDNWLEPLDELDGSTDRGPTPTSGRAGSEPAAAPGESPREAPETGAAGASAPPVPQAGAGGSAVMPAAAPKRLVCGAKSCEADREQCCVAMLRPFGVPVEADLSCQPRSAGAASGGAGAPAAPVCALSLQCASDADCASDTVCCMSAEVASCKPQAACDAELGRRLACKQPSECPQGQKCCLHMDSTGLTFVDSACAATCELANGAVPLCAADADCQNDATASTCSTSILLPAVRACLPAF